jgi:hypothetical protein
MIWHIFKKDVKLTWPLAAVVAALNLTSTGMIAMMGAFPDPRLRSLLGMLGMGGLLGSIFLIMTAVHQDAIPGVRQDWLVRPIRRRDLVMAKLLFVVLIVELPIFLGDTAEVLVSGFSLTSSLDAAFQRALFQTLAIYIPFLAFASLTRNLLEAVSGGAVLGLTVAIAMEVTSKMASDGPGIPGISLEPAVGTGLEWIVTCATITVLMLGAIVVLWLQYFRRRNFSARILTGGVAALCLVTPLMPWRPAFAVQKSLSNAPESSRAVALGFDPSAGRFRPPAGALTPDDALAVLRRDEGVIQVYLPLSVSGLPPDSALQTDHSEVRLIEPNGSMERLTLDRWNAREGSGGQTPTVYSLLGVPAAVYKRNKDQPVRIEADFWLTLVQIASSYALPSIDGDQHIPGVGRCQTKVNDAETAVQLRCLDVGAPACLNFFLEDVPNGQRNPGRLSCGNYAPFLPRDPFVLRPNGPNLPFRDASGLARFPVDGSKLRESRTVIQVYEVQDHFTRKVIIPDIRLGEWVPETPGS